MELGGRLVVPVYGGVEEGLAATLDLVLDLEGPEEAMAGPEVGD